MSMLNPNDLKGIYISMSAAVTFDHFSGLHLFEDDGLSGGEPAPQQPAAVAFPGCL